MAGTHPRVDARQSPARNDVSDPGTEPGSARRAVFRRWAGSRGATALAVIGLASTAAVASGYFIMNAGPQGLEASVNKIGWYGAMEPGAVFTDGMQQMFPLGDEPVEIIDVQAGADGDLEFLGAMIAGPERNAQIQSEPGFPPDLSALGDLVPAEGAVLEPLPHGMSGNGYELLLGYEVGHAARSVRDDVTVTYRVGGVEKKVVYKYGLAICTSGTNEECGSPFS